MRYKLLFTCFLFVLSFNVPSIGQTNSPEKAICGKWECTDKSIIIDIFMQDNQFKAKLIWYKDTEGKPMDYWTDVHNPDPALRNRKILGLSMLSGLTYYSAKNRCKNTLFLIKKCRFLTILKLQLPGKML